MFGITHPPTPEGLGPDHVIRWFATRQAGVVTRRQLVAAGLTAHQIDGRIARGVLVRLHRGVYAFGVAPDDFRGRVFAALLAAPAGAVASHRTAAVLRGALPDRRGPVHATVVGAHHRRRGVVLHRSASGVRTATTVDGIPCTSTPRTLIDVAATEGAEAAGRAWSSLAGRRTLVPAAIEAEVRRAGRRRGVAAVRGLLETHRQAVTGRTRSVLEADALQMCATYGLATPRCNQLIETADGGLYEGDLVWDEPRVVVEIDDWSTHGHPDAFRADRRRDLDLALSGWHVVRLLGHDVREAAPKTAARLHRLFERRRRPADG